MYSDAEARVRKHHPAINLRQHAYRNLYLVVGEIRENFIVTYSSLANYLTITIQNRCMGRVPMHVQFADKGAHDMG